jgi:hypothetical protein
MLATFPGHPNNPTQRSLGLKADGSELDNYFYLE